MRDEVRKLRSFEGLEGRKLLAGDAFEAMNTEVFSFEGEIAELSPEEFFAQLEEAGVLEICPVDGEDPTGFDGPPEDVGVWSGPWDGELVDPWGDEEWGVVEWGVVEWNDTDAEWGDAEGWLTVDDIEFEPLPNGEVPFVNEDGIVEFPGFDGVFGFVGPVEDFPLPIDIIDVEPIGEGEFIEEWSITDAELGDDIHADEIGDTATALELNEFGYMADGWLASNIDTETDVDVFQFTTDADKILSVGAFLMETGAPLDVQLVDAEGNAVDLESPDAETQPAGSYYVAVSSPEGATGAYFLDVFAFDALPEWNGEIDWEIDDREIDDWDGEVDWEVEGEIDWQVDVVWPEETPWTAEEVRQFAQDEIDTFDQNGDGELDVDELAAEFGVEIVGIGFEVDIATEIASALISEFDLDGNGGLSVNEIVASWGVEQPELEAGRPLAALAATMPSSNSIDQVLGDANLDGLFDSSDLVDVMEMGKYESSESANWSEGDWNNDGKFDSSDLVAALQSGNYTK